MKKKAFIAVRIDQDVKLKLEQLSDVQVCHVSDLIRDGINTVLEGKVTAR